jgi:hypothetical protein
LERNNKDMEVTDWLTYFARTVVEAQSTTIRRVDFYIAKAKFYERLRDQLNERQAKLIARMFREDIDGGLSAENYITITGTSRATAHAIFKTLSRRARWAARGSYGIPDTILNLAKGPRDEPGGGTCRTTSGVLRRSPRHRPRRSCFVSGKTSHGSAQSAAPHGPTRRSAAPNGANWRRLPSRQRTWERKRKTRAPSPGISSSGMPSIRSLSRHALKDVLRQIEPDDANFLHGRLSSRRGPQHHDLGTSMPSEGVRPIGVGLNADRRGNPLK